MGWHVAPNRTLESRRGLVNVQSSNYTFFPIISMMIEDHAEEGLLSAAADTQVSIASIEPIASEIEASAPSAEDISLGNESYHIDPVLQEYREACQTGDLTKVKELIESGRIDISHDYDEKERISGLHWASINNRLGIVRYLIGKGANVDFQGGDLNATPLHWAARYGYVYIVDSLLESGADASLTDHQGFNLLHLSINSSNIMLVLYVLYFVVGDKLSVDCLDPNNRTPLLWAAYQGDSLSVKALLEFNANLNIADSGGFLPPHWATVKGQPTVLKYLLEGGSDFFQKTADNKDCFVISQEMHTQESLTNSLQESGFKKDGTPIMKLFRNPRHAKLITFIIPGLLVGLNLKLAFCYCELLCCSDALCDRWVGCSSNTKEPGHSIIFFPERQSCFLKDTGAGRNTTRKYILGILCVGFQIIECHSI